MFWVNVNAGSAEGKGEESSPGLWAGAVSEQRAG